MSYNYDYYDQIRQEIYEDARRDEEDESYLYIPAVVQMSNENKDLERCLEDIKGSLKEVVHMLYSQDNLDIAKLDDVISSIAYELDIRIPDETLSIERKKDRPSLFYMSLGADLARLQVNR